MRDALLVLLVLLVVAIVWREVQHAVYRSGHKFTDGDLVHAREDSLVRSRHVVSGKVQEHLAPLFPEFITKFNPRDARFLGTPLDFVVFDGLDEGEVRSVVFVEVKTGKATLSPRERHVRDAVQAGRVSYELMRLPGSVAEPSDLSIETTETPPALQP